METLKSYQIDLKNLSLSTTYNFDYLLDNAFFERIDGPEVKKGKVNVSLAVVRVLSTFEMVFRIEGVVVVACDRCLDDVEIPVKTTNRLVITFGEMFDEINDEHIVISEEEGIIDISWYLYEFIALAIPIKHVHQQGECNEMMAAKLNELCVDIHLSDEINGESDDNPRNPDPRWEALRQLKEDN